jgi:hypothetical protein
MEREPVNEKISHLDLDTYLAFLSDLNTIDGELIEDLNHGFYVWLTNQNPTLQNIDGVRLDALYNKNVVEGDMSTERFEEYCLSFGFLPSDPDKKASIVSGYNEYIAKVYVEKQQEYEDWAAQNGIDVRSGAVTKFYDSEGNIFRVRTDFENSGEII